MPKIFAAFLMLLLVMGAPAHAQSALVALTAPKTAPPAAAAPALTPAEAQQIVDLLNDPQKRAAFAATLQTLAKASAAVAPPKPASPVPLAPDSIGAQVLTESSTWLTGLARQFNTFGRILGDLPDVWAFTKRTVQNPALRAAALDAGWRLALVLAVAVLAEFGTARLLRRPMRAIAAHAPGNADTTHPEETAVTSRIHARVLAREDPDAETESASAASELPPEDPELENSEPADSIEADLDGARLAGLPEDEREDVAVEHVLRRRRFSRTMRALKRLPFVLLCFLLDLMPLAVFMGIGYIGTLFATPHIQAVLQAAILAYTVCRLATTVTRMFVSPEYPALRLAHVSDEGAAYAVVWVRRIFAVGAFGYAASQIGVLFGLPAAANDAFLKAVFLLVHLFLIIIVLQCRATVADRIRSHSGRQGLAVKIRKRLAAIWHLIAIFYIGALWLVWAAEVRNGYVRIWHLFLVTMAVLIVARLVAIVVLGGLDRAFRVSPDLKNRYPGLEQRANRYYPLLRSTVSTILVVIAMLTLLQAWGIDTLAWFRANALGSRLVSACVTIIIAAALALAIWEGTNASMDRHLSRLTREAQMVKSARLRTLLPMLRTLLLSILIGIFGLTTLSEIGVNIAPLLAGAGILGVAIGFGSQKLVQDFITGIFLLVENAMQVGDWVTVAGLSGAVENLSIRTMRLRAGDGSVHIIPFSSVSTVTNVNRGIGNAAITVNVPIEEDSDQVCDVLGEIARTMRAERRFEDMMRSDLQLWGVDKVDAGVVTIAGQIVCTDSGRWAVQREFNRRMMIRFKELNIHIATPVTTVFNHIATEAPKPVQQVTSDRPAGQLSESPPPAALGNTS